MKIFNKYACETATIRVLNTMLLFIHYPPRPYYDTLAILYAKQKHPGCKKRRGQSEAAVIK